MVRSIGVPETPAGSRTGAEPPPTQIPGRGPCGAVGARRPDPGEWVGPHRRLRLHRLQLHGDRLRPQQWAPRHGRHETGDRDGDGHVAAGAAAGPALLVLDGVETVLEASLEVGGCLDGGEVLDETAAPAHRAVMPGARKTATHVDAPAGVLLPAHDAVEVLRVTRAELLARQGEWSAMEPAALFNALCDTSGIRSITPLLRRRSGERFDSVIGTATRRVPGRGFPTRRGPCHTSGPRRGFPGGGAGRKKQGRRRSRSSARPCARHSGGSVAPARAG